MALPDITARIAAIGPDGKPIVNGGETITASGGAKAEFLLIVTNNSAQPVGPIWVVGKVTTNGIGHPTPAPQQISLGAGQSRTYSYKSTITMPTEKWAAWLNVDLADDIAEANESNNVANHQFTAYSVG